MPNFKKEFKVLLKHKLIAYILAFSIIFNLTLILAYFVAHSNLAEACSRLFKVERANRPIMGKLTNPLLECEIPQGLGSVQFAGLEKSLTDFVNQTINQKKASHISVYVRDLNNGPWFGIGEQEKFTPSSLLKLPILIAALKQAEQDPSFLSIRVTTTKRFDDLNQLYKPAKTVEPGKSYSLDELLDMMIINSDNQAKDILVSKLDPNILNHVYIDLGIILPPESLQDDYMTVKEYSSLFRVLYNASYLSHSSSEKALKLLSQVEFKEGLVGGVPQGIIVAHKFGERELPDGTNQLHDCGIVYFPNHPYLLCVMTRGQDLNSLPKVISGISRITYLEISNHYQKPDNQP